MYITLVHLIQWSYCLQLFTHISSWDLILVQKFDFLWYVLDVQLISVSHKIPEKYFTATDAHQLKIWVILRKIVMEGCHTRPLVIGPLAAGFASLYKCHSPFNCNQTVMITVCVTFVAADCHVVLSHQAMMVTKDTEVVNRCAVPGG